MKTIFIAVLMMISMQTIAQSDFDQSIDKENESVVYKGQFTFDDLKKEESFTWLEKGAEDYKPNKEAIVFLKKNLPDYDLVVLLGTWCGDSQVLIPKLYKTLQLTDFPMKRYSMYGVDHAKEAKYIEHKLYRVEKVPTIIIFKNNFEIGRIVESTKKSIEEDLMEIIKS